MKSREIGMDELGSIIKTVMEEVDRELELDSDEEAEEIEADEYADTLAHHVDYEKALNIKPTVESVKNLYMKESKALRLAKMLRAKRLRLMESAEKAELKAENERLKKALIGIKKSK